MAIEAVSVSRHRNQDAVLPQLSLVIEGALLAAAVRVVNEAGDRTPHGDGPARSRQCQFLVKPTRLSLAIGPEIAAPGRVQTAKTGASLISAAGAK
jgi:hypothetical protein